MNAQVVWGMKKLELALALDNTGSMDSSNKMTELKKAAKSLIQTLKAVAMNDDDIKIAIVPFAQEVNVGTGNVNAKWLNWEEWDEENGDDVSKTVCNGKSGKKKKCATSKTWVPANHKTWNGCVMDRDQDNDVLDTAPNTSIKSTLFPTIQASNCPVSILPLTSVKAHQGTLISKIETMKPTGTTNVTIGLTWGWHALTPNSPMTEGTAPNPETDKVIILLTDGDNTENRWTKNSSRYRRPDEEGVRQRQGGRHQALYRPRDRRQRGAAPAMRHPHGHVFQRAERDPAQRRVQPDRQQPGEPAHLPSKSQTGGTPLKTKARPHGRAFFMSPQAADITLAASDDAPRPALHWNATVSFALNCAFSKLSRSSRRCGLSVERPAI